MRRQAVALLWIAVAWAIAGRAQAPTSAGGPALVTIPVVVHDRDGHAVADLAESAFQLSDNGKVQPLASFSVEGAASAGTAAGGPKHLVAYFFDDVIMRDIRTVTYLRQAVIGEFANFRPEDQAAVYASSCRLSQDFTGDTAALRKAVLSLQPNPVAVCRQGDKVPLQIMRLREIVHQMASVDGPKRLVVASSSLYVAPDSYKIRDRLIDEALQAHIRIDGLHLPDPNVGPRRDPRDLPDPASATLYYGEPLFLTILARATGGSVAEGENSAEDALRQLASPVCVYLLSFAPATTADGSSHKIKVTLNDRRKLTVSARTSYYPDQLNQ